MIENLFLIMAAGDFLGVYLFGITRIPFLTYSVNESLRRGVNEVSLLNIQPSCFDWLSFCIATFACAVAVVTCVFTIYMYILVKTQLSVQIKQFGDTQEKDIMVRNETKAYVNQIRIHFVNETMVRLLDKIIDFKESFELLCDNISKHKTQLLRKPNYECVETMLQDVKSVEYYLSVIKDTFLLLNKDDQIIKDKTNDFTSLLNELKKEGVANELKEVETWLIVIKEKSNGLMQVFDHSYNLIKQEITESN